MVTFVLNEKESLLSFSQNPVLTADQLADVDSALNDLRAARQVVFDISKLKSKSRSDSVSAVNWAYEARNQLANVLENTGVFTHEQARALAVKLNTQISLQLATGFSR